MKTYICPHCKEKQEILVFAEECIVNYHYDLEQQSWEEEEINNSGVGKYYCRNCGNELPEKLIKEISKKHDLL